MGERLLDFPRLREFRLKTHSPSIPEGRGKTQRRGLAGVRPSNRAGNRSPLLGTGNFLMCRLSGTGTPGVFPSRRKSPGVGVSTHYPINHLINKGAGLGWGKARVYKRRIFSIKCGDVG